jgi:molecular chaperone IbpA
MKPNLNNLLASHIGFDRLFNELDSFFERGYVAPSFPPYNIIKEGQNYKIEVALAGYKKSDVKVSHDKKKGVLVISSEKAEDKSDNSAYLIKKVAARSFKTTLMVADNIEISKASMEDGILTINLVTVEKEDGKVQYVNIT